MEQGEVAPKFEPRANGLSRLEVEQAKRVAVHALVDGVRYGQDVQPVVEGDQGGDEKQYRPVGGAS